MQRRPKHEHYVDVRAPPRHPDHPNGCSPLLRIFICITCAGGCMICGVVVATATLAPFTMMDPTTIQLARKSHSRSLVQMRASVDQMVTSLMIEPSAPPSPPRQLARERIERASTVTSRKELWKRVPQWFDESTGTFNAVTASIDMSTVLNSLLEQLNARVEHEQAHLNRTHEVVERS